MRLLMWAIVALVLSGCTGVFASQPAQPGEKGESTAQENEEVVIQKSHPVLEDLGPAPELENEVWLNSEGPLRLADLRGEVVLLDMWTFG